MEVRGRAVVTMTLLSVAVSVTAVAQAWAKAGTPEITDISGDANGTLVDLHSAPASYDPLDLVSVDLSTTYREVRRGDGVDRIPTGVRFVFDTLGDPLSAAAPATFRALFGNGDWYGGFEVTVVPPEWKVPDGRHLQIEWQPWSYGCSGTTEPYEGWPASIDATGRVVVDAPFDQLDHCQAQVLSDGARLRDLTAQTTLAPPPLWSYGIDVDMAARASDFVVGADVPADVPCTSGC